MFRKMDKSTSVSCVYDILQNDGMSEWTSDGVIRLNRPNMNVNLTGVKFRSFSASLRSNIQNLTSPQINAKLCANFTLYGHQSETVTPVNNPTKDVVEGTEVSIKPDINGMSLIIYNQSGFHFYEGANGIYHNNINNEIILASYDIPLITSFQDSVNDMLNYSKHTLMQILGLFDDSEINKNLYDTSTFVYGEVNTKPYVSELGGFKWINSAHTTASHFQNDAMVIYGLTYDEGTQNPVLTFGGYKYNQVIITPQFSTETSGLVCPYGFVKVFVPVRYNKKRFVFGIRPTTEAASLVTKPTVASPWISPGASHKLADPWNIENVLTGESWVSAIVDGFVLTCSVFQNGENYIMSYYQRALFGDNTIETIKEKRLAFTAIYKDGGGMDDTFFRSFIRHNGANTYISFSNLIKNNPRTEFDEQLGIMEDEGYFLLSYTAIDYTEALEGDAWRMYLILAFTNNVNIKILRFEIDTATASYTFNADNAFPKLKEITTIKLSKRFAYVDHDWNVDNYLEFLSDLNNVNVPNAPVLILPKYTDGTNDAMTIYYHDGGEGNIVFKYKLMDESTEGGNIWYSNNTLYTSRYKEGRAQISMCRTINVVLDESGEHMNIGVAGAICLNNYLWNRWWPNRYKLYARDITSYVEKYNLKFPMVNALTTFTFDTTILDDTHKQPVNETDSLVWLIDATGAQVYIKDQTFENVYSFAQSAITVKIKQGTAETVMHPAIPDIQEPTGISATSYSWVNTKHITDTAANPYFYAAASTYSFLDNTFKVDDDGNITFPCIPCVTDDGAKSGLLTFFVKFNTTPEVITFDPNLKQSDRFANRYNFCKQFLNKTPSLYNDKYPFDSYILYNNETIYKNITTYLELKNRDLTLKLKSNNYPSLNNVIFHLNETSMVDFKEMVTSSTISTLEFIIIDADNEVLTPQPASNIYSNINICVDWVFVN